MNTDTTAVERRLAALEADLAELAYQLADHDCADVEARPEFQELCTGIYHRFNLDGYLAMKEAERADNERFGESWSCGCHGCRWRESAA